MVTLNCISNKADAASLPEAAKQAALDAVEKLIAECDLTRTAQDILGHYLELEKYSYVFWPSILVFNLIIDSLLIIVLVILVLWSCA